MKLKSISVASAAAICALSLVAAHAVAQTKPADKAKPSAKPEVRKLAPSPTSAAPAPSTKIRPGEKLMTRDELRACFKDRATNDASAKAVIADQEQFKKDYDAIRAEGTQLRTDNEAARAQAAAIQAERQSVNERTSLLGARAATAKTDEEKATYEKDRQALLADGRAVDAKVEAFNAAQASLRERSNAFDAKVAPINERQKAINTRVEAQTATVNEWTTRCNDRAYDELDEIAVKKEMAAGK
jgi:chromosome segregation ATPase